MSYDYPKNADEWWAITKENQEDLLYLIAKYHPYYQNTHNDPITAELAEKVCEGVRKSINEEAQDDPQIRFRNYLTNHNTDLAVLLNEVWWGMPESTSVRSLPGFDVLCDLCSEAYVLDEEEEI